MAVLFAVAKFTVIVWLLAFERETVNVAKDVPVSPSFTDTLFIEIAGCASSFVIVPTP